MTIAAATTIDYANKRIDVNPGDGDAPFAVNVLYGHLMDLFDDAAQMDDQVPISGTTLVYQMINGWFITGRSIQALKGAALESSGWNDVVRVITMQAGGYTNAVAGDIGKTVTGGTTGDTGTLLDYDNTARKWWVRMDDSGDLFDNGTEGLTIASGTGAGTMNAVSTTGEMLWNNVFSVGSIAGTPDPLLYLLQDGAEVMGFDGSAPWWPRGHIDVLVKVREAGTLIDSGLVTVFARQYRDTYTHFAADLSTAGRNVAALASDFDGGVDPTLGNEDALQLSVADEAGFTVGLFARDTTTGAYGEIVGVSSGQVDIGHVDETAGVFTNGNTLAETTDGTAAGDTATTTTINAVPTNVVKANAATLTIGYAGPYAKDIGDGNGNQNYDTDVDCGGLRLHEVYEALQYLTRESSTATVDSVEGRFYTKAAAGYAEIVGAPFGTFAGGKLFGARGIWLENMHADDANNYQLIDSAGVTRSPPALISAKINGLQSGIEAHMFPSQGPGSLLVDKAQFTSAASGNNASDGDFVIQEAIPADTPSTGFIIVSNADGSQEHYAYTSWASSTFTLSGTLSKTYDGTSTVCVPYIRTTAAGAEVSVSLTYVADRDVVTVCRDKGVMQPFSVAGKIVAAGYTATCIITPDPITTP